MNRTKKTITISSSASAAVIVLIGLIFTQTAASAPLTPSSDTPSPSTSVNSFSMSSTFVDAKLKASRVPENAEIKDLSKRDGYLQILSSVLDSYPKLKEVLADADYRHDILVRLPVGAEARPVDSAASVKITEDEANTLTSIWESNFEEVDQTTVKNFVDKTHYIKIQTDGKYYFVSIYIVYTQ